MKNNTEKVSKESVYDYLTNNIFAINPQKNKDQIGIEIEMLPIFQKKQTYDKPKYAFYDNTVSSIIEFSQKENWQEQYEEKDIESKILLKINDSDNNSISYEPGGQIEIATSPSDTLSKALDKLTLTQNSLKKVLQKKKNRTSSTRA